ncbi:MAG: ribosomal RNA small subunit methyltransferase A [Deltaproteobacteria bacterium]|nr:MAG: ribosomal RNA small subunit methyltransferase A [Deltaproteobacteria bacterium]
MKANKRLGQHFLRDPEVLADIAAIADVERSAGVLEIGPGEGALTAFLARSGRPVVALEKDARAVAELGERFGDRVRVVEGDALTADLKALLPSAEGALPVVVGNLPYNVGGAIYQRLLTLRGAVSRMVLMLQREVAVRLIAQPKTRAYGIPSVVTALLAKAWLVRDVPPRAFAPPPKVESSIVLVELLPDPPLTLDELDAFDRFLVRMFHNRRKTLGNSLDGSGVDLDAAGIARTARIEELDPSTLLALFRAATPEDGGEPRG